ncbi:hypothetical protein EVAR_56110_1 [Eumeta japonica]|uniref:Uncharacterized protein n=1 Tax=Eumeta variegata TaxID=151549 RepID=A0A4C1YGM2_EUMVA|nr:hypothetical protein EVAR_56110_1 [Eumeta japonica]
MPKVANEISPRYTRGRYRARTRLRDGFLAATASFNKERKSSKAKLNTRHIGFTGEFKAIYIIEHLMAAVKDLYAAVPKHAKELNYKFA